MQTCQPSPDSATNSKPSNPAPSLLPCLFSVSSGPELSTGPPGLLIPSLGAALASPNSHSLTGGFGTTHVPSQGQSMSPQVSPANSGPACQRPVFWIGSSHHPLPCPGLNMLCWLHTSAPPHWACSLSSEIGNLESDQRQFLSQGGQPAEACVSPLSLCVHTHNPDIVVLMWELSTIWCRQYLVRSGPDIQ